MKKAKEPENEQKIDGDKATVSNDNALNILFGDDENSHEVYTEWPLIDEIVRSIAIKG